MGTPDPKSVTPTRMCDRLVKLLAFTAETDLLPRFCGSFEEGESPRLSSENVTILWEGWMVMGRQKFSIYSDSQARNEAMAEWYAGLQIICKFCKLLAQSPIFLC